MSSMMRALGDILRGAFFALALCAALFAFFSARPASARAERKVFTFSADSTSASLAEGKEFTRLSGSAEVTADDVRIRAENIMLYGDGFQFAEVTGRFSAYDMKNDFSLEGNSLLYDREEKVLRAEGNIVMRDNKNDVVIRANFLESKDDGKFMVVQLGVRITQKEDLSARSEFVTYYRETDELQMTGFPYALYKGDEYSADRISINLTTDAVELAGAVSGVISTQSAEAAAETPAAGTTTGPAAGAAPEAKNAASGTAAPATGETAPAAPQQNNAAPAASPESAPAPAGQQPATP